ncbi:hypothetical protein [Rhodococcus aetherivorans]|uniref:hypothetical protein n=1 Tax=Rhodococcus aetherivorans TaxID=191292 RepID=UPI0029494C59|nr:hypothetical protein [Rhodococcus aetherivorans]MDV6295174.1 hypothetical protein [Rhodococcus aetherivorans]
MADQEKTNQLVTDVAVIKSELVHINANLANAAKNDERILKRIEELSVVSREEFVTYKQEMAEKHEDCVKTADEKYLHKSELAGLVKLWTFLTDKFVQLIGVAILIVVLSVVVSKTQIAEFIK